MHPHKHTHTHTHTHNQGVNSGLDDAFALYNALKDNDNDLKKGK